MYLLVYVNWFGCQCTFIMAQQNVLVCVYNNSYCGTGMLYSTVFAMNPLAPILVHEHHHLTRIENGMLHLC